VGQGGFDYNPDAVRGFAEVFNQAKIQVDQIKGNLANTTAKAADFGRSWGAEGAEFEKYIKAMADDLTNLATHLGNIGANLMQGTDLVVNADTSGYQSIKKVEVDLGDAKTPPGPGGNRAV
jgi:uncharacterized protein YukE